MTSYAYDEGEPCEEDATKTGRIIRYKNAVMNLCDFLKNPDIYEIVTTTSPATVECVTPTEMNDIMSEENRTYLPFKYLSENTPVGKYCCEITAINEYIEFKKQNRKAIRIKYFTDIIPVETRTNGDWIDLRCAYDMELKKDEFALIPLGVGMILPDGYEAYIVPRSSTFKNYGILQTNSIGVIDNSYSGDNDEWKMPVRATRDVTIQKNDRICQFRIMKKMPDIQFDIVEHLNANDRGGFGSTGVK